MIKNDISIIFLLYKTPYKVIKNLENYKNFKVLIFDQSNDYKLKQKIKKKFPKLQYYGLTNKNKGFAKGINHLVKKVKTKYFLCTQPDIFINQKSILELKKIHIKKKNCIISVPKIIGLKNYKIKKNKKENIVPIKDMIGAVFLADKKKFSYLKMFDENFVFYWEDVDLSNRIQKSKFKIYINHKTIAKHSGSASTVFDLKTFFIRKSNFKYGEYLYQYKYKKLKFIKIIREPIMNLLFSFFYLMTLRPKNFFEKIFYIYGIFKFIIFKLFNTNYKFIF